MVGRRDNGKKGWWGGGMTGKKDGEEAGCEDVECEEGGGEEECECE